MLHGRLIDGAGEPLADTELTFLINSHVGRLEGEEVVLDEKGRVHLPYKVNRELRGPFRLEIRNHDVSPTAGLAKTLRTLPPGQVTDLGDLVIDAFTRIAYGTVVNDLGQPISDSEIQLLRERDVGDERPKLECIEEAFATVESDAEGHYELFGELEPARYRVRAEAEDHFPHESTDLRPGAPVEVQLQRKSRVVGTVLRPDWMSGKSLRVCLESVSNPQQRRDDRVHENKGKDYIFFDWVRPGLYNLSLTVRNFPDPFLRIDGLEILPGQIELHPRLKDLDLGAYLYRFEVTAVDENGQRISPERPLLAKIVRPDGRSAYVGVPWKSPQIEVTSASAQLEVIPMANGYSAEPTVLAQSRNEVHFARMPRVELVVPGLRQLVGETHFVMIMELQGNTDMPDQLETWDRPSHEISRWYANFRNARARLGNGDSVELTLSHDGRYRVIASLRSSSKRVRPVPVELGNVEVKLTPGMETQRITVNADVEQIQQALAALAQREAAAGSGR